MRRMLLGGLTFLVLAGCTGAPQAKYPVDGLQGNFTVVAYHFWNTVDRDGSVTSYALTDANRMAAKLRQTGQKAYIADLGMEALVVVGSYPSMESARSAAQGLGKVLEQSLGLPQMQVHVVGPRGGPAPSLVLQPQGVDLKVLKDRVRALREHRLRITSGRVGAAPPPAEPAMGTPVELGPAPAR